MAKDEIVSIANSMNMNLSKLHETVTDRDAWSAVVHGLTKSDMTWQLHNIKMQTVVRDSKHSSTGYQNQMI